MLKARLFITLALAIAGPCHAGQQEAEAAFKAQDYARALAEAQPLAASGNPRAQHLMGILYQQGLGVPVDDAKALTLYQQAAAQGYAPSQYCLATRYYLGQGVPQDEQRAMTFMQKSADQGDIDAQYFLGTTYKLDGLTGTPQAHFKSYLYFFIASENGQKSAKIQLPAEVVFLTDAQVHDAQAAARHYLKEHPVHFEGDFP